MQITLSYWQIEEAVIAYLLQKYGYEIESGQIQDSSIKTTATTYAYKKNADGKEVVDREKTKTKEESQSFDADSEIQFYIEPPSKSSSNVEEEDHEND